MRPAPVKSGLQFYRKHQTFDHLAFERPQSLQAIRDAVSEAVKHILWRLERLETSYYGSDRNPRAEMEEWLPVLNNILHAANVSELTNKGFIDMVSDKMSGPFSTIEVELSTLKKVEDCINRVLSITKSAFSDITDAINKLAEYMKKYLLSFSPKSGDPYMETATNYEKQRLEFAHAIKSNGDNIGNMVERFETDSLRINNFSYNIRELGSKYKCTHVSFMLIFPAACENIRNACTGIKKWLEADDEYPMFIQFDMDDLDKKKELQIKLSRESKQTCINIEHKIKYLQKEMISLNTELGKLIPKEKVLKSEEEQLMNENRDVLVDLDIKEYRREAMRQNTEELEKEDYMDRYRRLISEINSLRDRKPALDRKLDDLRKRMKYIEDKRALKCRKETELSSLAKELRSAKKVSRKADVELERLEGNFKKLKEIHKLKTLPETLKKIFHNMPFNLTSTTQGKRRLDKLDRSIRIVANCLDNDWIRFYRALPFYPPRGDETINSDIDFISMNFMRHTQEAQARESLIRWRRMHTRACVSELRETLILFHRKDIIKKLEEKLSPKSVPCPVRPKHHRTVRFPRSTVRIR